MNVIWSEFASSQLFNIYKYHKAIAGNKVANKIKNNIFEGVRQLKDHPFSGPLELHLEKFNEGHRYL